MSSPGLWLSIEPRRNETRLMLSTMTETTLKAVLPPWPSDPRALSFLLDGLVGWYGEPLCAVLDADAQDVKDNAARWSILVGDLGAHIDVAWAVPPKPYRHRSIEGMGDFGRARGLLKSARGLR